MARRVLVNTGSAFEEVFGYSRAVRVGNVVTVAGTTAASPDGAIGGANVEEQTREVFRRVEHALQQAGSGLGDVVRTRFFVTDIMAWKAIGRVHSSIFDGILPASTIVEVSALVLPELLVEVEVDAVVADE
ncbi:Rid family hydrolase [Micromonospora marina]|uniref:Rid family hydrolase n=1 Tax=Micromonospora marina TaxID=307120 RepID=UPI003D72C9D4